MCSIDPIHYAKPIILHFANLSTNRNQEFQVCLNRFGRFLSTYHKSEFSNRFGRFFFSQSEARKSILLKSLFTSQSEAKLCSNRSGCSLLANEKQAWTFESDSLICRKRRPIGLVQNTAIWLDNSISLRLTTVVFTAVQFWFRYRLQRIWNVVFDKSL